MANRRNTMMGIAAGIVVVGGAATLVATHRGTTTTTSPTSKTHSTTPKNGGKTHSPGASSAPLMMPTSGKIASDYGWQYSGALNEWYYNPGITIAAKAGAPVKGAWAGTVAEVTHEPHMGLTVTVNDGDGFETVYGHLGKSRVKAGATVRQGQVIGSVGGASLYSRNAGAHLDFQVYHGSTATNPMSYLHPSS